jgi:outer membrane protein assembly factor BamB
VTTSETLEDHLRRATRNFTARLPEDDVFRLGLELARELQRAHEDEPPRHPDLDPASIAMSEGKPRLAGGLREGDAGDDLFRLGALLASLAGAAPPDVSWLLDGPPPLEAATLPRRAALGALTVPAKARRLSSAGEAVTLFERALASEPEQAGPWPLFRGDEARSGWRAEAAAARPRVLWETPLGGGVVASPLLTARLVVAAGADGRLHFVDRDRGRVLYELRVGSAVESSPALSDGVVHLGTDDGEIVGIELATGRERYRVRVGKLVRSSPLPTGGRVIVGVVESRTAGALVALDASTGKLAWSRKLGAVFSSPALAGPHVLVGSDDGSVHAIEPVKGGLVWSRKLGARVRATPAVSGDLALAADFEGRLAAIGVGDGKVAWQRELGHAVYSSPCRAGEAWVLGCHEGHLHGIDAATGEPRFETLTRGPIVSSPVALGDRLYVGSTDGAFYQLDRQGGVLERLPLSTAGIHSSPAADAGLIVIGSGHGLHALGLTA